MTESQLCEKIGRMQLAIETKDAAYTQLLNVLAGVIKGEIDTSRVMVNLTASGWTVAPDGMRPELPATINGLPVCVVAPAKPEPASEPAPVPTA